MNEQQVPPDLVITLGHDQLIVHRRYEVISVVNDLMLAIWFVIGSICFFYSGDIEKIGVWLFLVGSLQLMIRPIIRLIRNIHLRHIPQSSHSY